MKVWGQLVTHLWQNVKVGSSPWSHIQRLSFNAARGQKKTGSSIELNYKGSRALEKNEFSITVSQLNQGRDLIWKKKDPETWGGNI